MFARGLSDPYGSELIRRCFGPNPARFDAKFAVTPTRFV